MTATARWVGAGVGLAVAVAWWAVYDTTDGETGTTAMPQRDFQRVNMGDLDPLALERARVTYTQLCQPCHGAHGDGRGEWAYRVTPRPINLTAARTQRRSDAELFTAISEPRIGSPMIGWSRQLSAAQRWQLVAYLRWLGQRAQEVRHQPAR